MFKLVVAFYVLASVAAFGFQPRITGGSDAFKHEAPYIVSIQITFMDMYIHSCGGSVIGSNWALTAAHCLSNRDQVPILRIAAGRHNVTKISEDTEQVRPIDYYKIHESYTGGPTPFDIALIHVKEPFIETKAVRFVNLPKPFSDPKGIARLYGWGVISRTFDNERPHLLQKTTVPIISNEECQQPLMPQNVHKTNLCTGSTDQGLSSCSSDSGGPLVQKDELEGDVLVGIVSWGPIPCGKVGNPSVFVKVSHFIPWIEDEISKFESSELQ